MNLVKPLTQNINREWIVVNEPFVGKNGSSPDIFRQVLGDEYVDIAFEWVRELDSSATLVHNDTLNHVSRGYNSIWNISESINTEQTRKIGSRLKEKGLIDGVGAQMHLDGANPPDTDDLIETIQSYGVPIYVTEFDVNMRNVNGTQEERLTQQAKIYGDTFDACIQSDVCNSFSIWEFGDKYSWLEDPQFDGSSDADPTPFDDNLEPKPAYYALYDVLSQYAAQKSSGATATSTP